MQKGTMIGKGMTAEVYEWGQDKVLKLHFDWYLDDWIKFEADIYRELDKLGIPSPAIYDIVHIEGRSGIIFQKIEGDSLLKRIQSKPWRIFFVARQMAQLHAEIHNYSSNTLPTQNKRLKDAIQDSANELKDKTEIILSYLDQLPSRENVCHGDFHPDNILVTDKQWIAIDWTNAYSGHPLSDVVRTCLMLRSPVVPEGISKFMIPFIKMMKQWLYSAYMKEYLRVGKATKTDIEEWLLPVAAARLRENIPGEKEWLLQIIKNKLQKQDI